MKGGGFTDVTVSKVAVSEMKGDGFRDGPRDTAKTPLILCELLTQPPACGVWGLGFGGVGFWVLGFGVWGLGLEVWLGFWAWGLGFGIEGSWCKF